MQKTSIKNIQQQEILSDDVVEKLKQAEDDIRNGRTMPAEEFFKELRELYGF